MRLVKTYRGVCVKPGDLVTGIDRSFVRSIYRIKKTAVDGLAIAALVSYAGDVVPDVSDDKNEYHLKLDYYRLATPDEIEFSARQISFKYIPLDQSPRGYDFPAASIKNGRYSTHKGGIKFDNVSDDLGPCQIAFLEVDGQVVILQNYLYAPDDSTLVTMYKDNPNWRLTLKLLLRELNCTESDLTWVRDE